MSIDKIVWGYLDEGASTKYLDMVDELEEYFEKRLDQVYEQGLMDGEAALMEQVGDAYEQGFMDGEEKANMDNATEDEEL